MESGDPDIGRTATIDIDGSFNDGMRRYRWPGPTRNFSNISILQICWSAHLWTARISHPSSKQFTGWSLFLRFCVVLSCDLLLDVQARAGKEVRGETRRLSSKKSR